MFLRYVSGRQKKLQRDRKPTKAMNVFGIDTAIAQLLPQAYEEKVMLFQTYVIRLRLENRI